MFLPHVAAVEGRRREGLPWEFTAKAVQAELNLHPGRDPQTRPGTEAGRPCAVGARLRQEDAGHCRGSSAGERRGRHRGLGPSPTDEAGDSRGRGDTTETPRGHRRLDPVTTCEINILHKRQRNKRLSESTFQAILKKKKSGHVLVNSENQQNNA